MKVLTMWAEGIGRFEEGRGGVDRDEVALWRPVLGPLRIFPTMRGAWASLDDGLVLNDDDATARQFPEANVLRVEPAKGGGAAQDPNRKWCALFFRSFGPVRACGAWLPQRCQGRLFTCEQRFSWWLA